MSCFARCSVGLLLVVASLPSLGCTYAARLYDTQNGVVIPVRFTRSVSGRGTIEATLPSGEDFKGEYVTVGNDTTAWGSVFAAGSTINGYAVSAQGKRRGTAIVTSSHGNTIECEFLSNAGHGYGSCRDNARSKLYKLMF
jgi:hypothetical protein